MGACGCSCGSWDDEAEAWDDETRLRRADAVRAADGLTASGAYSTGMSVPAMLRAWWRARKVPTRNPKYPPRHAWEVNPSLRAQIEGSDS